MGCGCPGCPHPRSLGKPTPGLGSAPWSCRTQEAPWTKAQGGVPAEAQTLGLFRRPSTTPAHSRHLCWSWRFPSRYLPHLVAPSGLFFLFISTLFHKVFEAMFGKERDDRWRR